LEAINGNTRLVGVMGWPVEHTISPAMHNAAFDAASLNWRYLPLAVHPDRVGEAVRGLRAMSFAGSNVTVPHKRAVMDHLDAITEQAQAIGAVNTIVIQDQGHTIGHNTDAMGFLRALAEDGFRPEGKRAVVLGAGGAARALVYGLASIGASVTILNRTLSRAESLVADLACLFTGTDTRTSLQHRALPLTPAALQEMIPSADLLVNATSVGMWPEAERSPWPEELPIPPSLTVFDAVYNPLETKLMRQARAAGAHVIGGLGMLVHQGAAAWELWTEQDAPVAVMAAAARAAFSRDGQPG
jgi:shikimate dehydrogenase